VDTIRFTLNDRPVAVEGVPPTTTVLEHLRQRLHLTGTKEGCAEGDCGACTIAYVDVDHAGRPALRSVNACLVLLPMLHGRRVWTVEGLRAADGRHHPVQEALVQALGSQCGYCTPGVVMTMLEACYRDDLDAPWKLDDQMAGTLCRCTGYRPIMDATRAVAGARPAGAIAAALDAPPRALPALDYRAHGQRFVRPDSLEGLWAALDEAPDARFVAGATDLGLEVTKSRATWPVLICLEGIPALTAITARDGAWSIGAGVTLSALEAAAEDALPALARMLRYFGARQIKNRATVGGNLCNASPIGDLAPILLALGASARIAGPGGERTVPLADFFVGYRQTALAPGEILAGIALTAPAPGDRVAAYKVSKRRELDISAVAAGMYVRLDGAIVAEARLAYGGMAATPARATKTEAALVGQPWTEATVEAACARLAQDFTPLSDHRGSAWYRATLAANLLRGFFHETLDDPAPRLTPRHSGTVLGSQR
jgi:xanthine dehydrogenase small subunit